MCTKSILLGLLFFTSAVFAQNKVTIVVQDQDNQPLAGAILSLNDLSYHTNAQGQIMLDVKEEKVYAIMAYMEGYAVVHQPILLTNGSSHHLQLTRETTVLGDIQIKRQSEQAKVNREIIRAVLVDTKNQVLQPTSLSDLMNRSTGIRLRESGGLGGETSVNLNGFQGQAIRYFKDGIPLNYLGNGYNLSNVPIDLLQGVEVYKGVIPVHLASDALGGAINLLSHVNQTNHAQLSLTYGSFNTVRTALRGHYNLDDHFFIGGEFFSNYSDNDYKINTPDATIALEKTKVRLFHNRYRHNYVNAYVGAKHLKAAELLQLEVSYYALDKQVQNSSTTRLTPYGGIVDKQHSVVPSLRYKLKLAQERLSIDQFIAYNVVKNQVVDTVQGRYNWLGEFTPRGYRGEGDHPSEAEIDMTFLTSRTLLGWQWKTNHQLWVNNTYNYTKRVGSDLYGKKIEETQQPVIEIPSYYKKNVVAIGWTSQWLQQKIETTAIVKSYHYSSEGLNTAYHVDLRTKQLHHTSNADWGWALAFKYKWREKVNWRFSVEDARRLPSHGELFGDNFFIASNFNLKPEQSVNFNLGIDSESGRFTYRINGFYRQTKDIVVLTAGNPPMSLFVNKEKATGYGFEGDFSLKLNKQTKLYSNFTWQSIRYGQFEHKADQWLKGSRVPNIPYFFANLGGEHKFHNLFSNNDGLNLYAHLNFVREFYIQPIDKSMEPSGFLGLFGSSKGDVKNIVPDQTAVTLGAVYEKRESGWSIGVEVRNLLNQDLYDYFKIQKAGRSCYLKFNYKLN